MAKGIDVFGTLNGTLGEKVYYRSGGEQKSRIRVRKPKNPQTSKQIFQRARFSSAGMFYAHGRQSFFPYAFEDKRAGESNFNAFMRNNIARAYPVSKSVVDNVAYPIINDWIVTKGSLPSLECYLHSADEGRTTGLAFDVPNYTNISSVNTIADLSRVLIATGDYDNKDIVTFLTILTDMRISTPAYGLYPEITPTEAQAAHWFIYQFNLNTADHTPLENYRITAENILNDKIRINVWGPNTSWYDDQLACGTIIHSRVKGSRTQVSTQQLVLSQTAQAQLYTYLAPNYSTYIDEVLANWRTGDVSVQIRPTEVLQGANSVNYDFTPDTPENLVVQIYSATSVEGSWLRYYGRAIGEAGHRNDILYSLQFVVNGQQVAFSSLKFNLEGTEQVLSLPADDGETITIGQTTDGDWEGSVSNISDTLYIQADQDTSPATITKINAIKLLEVVIDGTTYTQFTYEIHYP